MVNINELRIGNLILYKDTIRQVVAIVKGKDNKLPDKVSIGGIIVPCDVINPVPLCNDLLEKCHFRKNLLDAPPAGEYYYDLDLVKEKYCDLSFISSDKNGHVEVCLFPYEEWFRFEYLHHVQNIYFSLCKKEMVIDFVKYLNP